IPSPPGDIHQHPVLVVEDTETSRELLETFLGSWSIPCTSVATAEEGVALVERRNRSGSQVPFGLVLLEWMLPGMNGLEAASRIRETGETRFLPLGLIGATAGQKEETRA